MRHLQATAAPGESRTVYDLQYGANQHTCVGAWIKRWAHCSGRGAILRRDNAPWLDIQFLLCIEKHGFIVRDTQIVVQYVNVSSGELQAVTLDFVAFHKRFDRLHIYSPFDY